MQDLRLACRSLVAAPIVSAVAILSIALGIGANTAIFSLVNALLLRPLPVSAPARLVTISSAGSYGLQWAWSYPVWDQIRQRAAPAQRTKRPSKQKRTDHEGVSAGPW